MMTPPQKIPVYLFHRVLIRVAIVGILFILPLPAMAFYGDILMNRTSKQFGFPPVTFPHWIHRTEFTCGVCHSDIFKMEPGGHYIKMERMVARKNFCSTCHDGKMAWPPVNCARCHQPTPPFSKANRDPGLLLKNLPLDSGGNIDWIEAIKKKLISPRSSLHIPRPTKGETTPPDVILSKTGSMPPVLFPHASHALWLECKNCHPSIFIAEKGANPISMNKIRAGQYCGKCHGKVSFPLSECNRCHRP